jgi:general secretion pathway protein E
MRRDLSEILINSGSVNKQQVQECLTAIQTSGQRLEQCLLEKGFLSPVSLAQTYATYAGIPYLDKISDTMADPLLLVKIPLKFLREHVVIPVHNEGKLTIITNNPLQFQPLDELNLMLGGDSSYAVSTSKVIIDAINRYYPIEGAKQMIEELEEEEKGLGVVDFADIEEKDIESMATEAPIIKLVNNILYQAVKRGASDIHIEPFEKELSVRYRIDGVLYSIMTPPKRIQGALVSRIKIMAHLNIAEKRIPQDGRIDIRVAGRPIDIRVSILPVVFGERVVMRLLDKSRTFGKLQDLGFSERDFAILMENIKKPNGIIFVTGPTGSGKTTTLYSILGELNNPEVNIVTVEDPVEYQMTGVGQVLVREKVGLTFAAALRSILRQDPDIIMIGEIRDQETAQIAIQAALTGHLVLSTLHTNSAPATITRLLDMGVEPYLIASSVILAMAQRLVRRLCENCKVAYKPSAEILASIGLKEKDVQGITFYEAKGCDECNQTGYRGRMPIFELMVMTPDIAHLTMERADTSLLRKQAQADGMSLLLDDGVRKIKAGLTSIDEVLSVASTEQSTVEE